MSDQGERVMRWTEMSDEAADRSRETGQDEGDPAGEIPVRMTFPEAKMPEVGVPAPANGEAEIETDPGALPPHDVWGKVETTGPEAEAGAPESVAPETAAPEAAAPEAVAPRTVPETVPETAPETAPETERPAVSEAVTPETVTPETALPETALPETALPETWESPAPATETWESPAPEPEAWASGNGQAEPFAETEAPAADDIKVAPVAAEQPPVPAESDADAYGERPAAGGQQAWEGSLFDGQAGGGGGGDDLYVTPTGPATPGKPGKPSSGNWQMPDWMQDEDSADAMLGKGAEGKRRFGRSRSDDKRSDNKRSDDRRSDDRYANEQAAAPVQESVGPAAPTPSTPSTPSTPPAPSPRSGRDHLDDEGSRSRLVLFGGVGLLVVALLAAGGVYLLKGRDGGGAAPSDNDQGPAGNKPPAQDVPKVELPPDKALARFAGRPSRMLGRVSDPHSGLSYPRLAAPWVVPTKKNKLGVTGWSGQQIVVTEKRGGQMWYGQLLTGTLIPTLQASYKGPDSIKQITGLAALGFEQNYYAFPHKKAPLASQELTVDGRKGWLIASYLTYKRAGVRATGEVVVAAVIDTGRKAPAVVFASMPNTHRKMWPDLNQFMTQLKVAR
ncbi:hypothetical protein [Spirillospora sp. NPDC047279]|uniref:hypothetical protein n=1 Tax=Spirillospora sp. NPDC047279 TaxID=3155478 RepID=UPI0034084A5A